MPVGENVRRWRERRSYDQAELARLAGIGINTLNRIENGGSVPRRQTVRKLAELLRVDPAILWGLDQTEEDGSQPRGTTAEGSGD